MKKVATLVALSAGLAAGQAPSSESIVFGPATYFRENGKPSAFTSSFPGPASTSIFTMRVTNAGVSSAAITLNGKQIFGPSDFSSWTSVLSKTVTLLTSNQLTVELRGKPGESLVVEIVGRSQTLQVAPPTAIPPVISVNTAATVTITSQISGHAPTKVELFRRDSSGDTLINSMNDAGTGGDAKAGDQVYTIQLPLFSASPGQFTYIVAAQLQGQSDKLVSQPVIVKVWPSTVLPSVGVTVNYPPTWMEQANPQPNTVMISNVPVLSPASGETLNSESFFFIRRLLNANASSLPIAAWVDAYFAGGLANEPLSRTNLMVDGRPAVKLELIEIQDTVHIYIVDNTDIVEVAYPLNSPALVENCLSMLAGLHIQSTANIVSPRLRALAVSEAASSGDAVDIAASFVGRARYEAKPNPPLSFDCSALTQYSYAQVGVTLPGNSRDQFKEGVLVSEPFQRGDLLFFATSKQFGPDVISHVTIYEAGNVMIHAPGTGRYIERTPAEHWNWWMTTKGPGKANFKGARRLAQITLVNPKNGEQGRESLEVVITGTATHFASSSRVDFGNGITIGSTNVIDATHLTARISINGAAALGSRTVSVTTGGEVASLANGFTVIAGAPQITLINPSSGQQGQTGLAVAITGQGTHFAAGTSVVNFGAGITVGTVTVTDATHLTAQIAIDASATVGARTVTVTTGVEAVSLANGFGVTTERTATLSISIDRCTIGPAAVVSVPAGINCTQHVGGSGTIAPGCSASFPLGTVVAISATPAATFQQFICIDDQGNVTAQGPQPVRSGPLTGNRTCHAIWPVSQGCL